MIIQLINLGAVLKKTTFILLAAIGIILLAILVVIGFILETKDGISEMISS